MSERTSFIQAQLFRLQGWRGSLIAALVGLLLAMAGTLAWLVDHQVDVARERRLLEAAAREASARCFEQATHRAIDECQNGGTRHGRPAQPTGR